MRDNSFTVWDFKRRRSNDNKIMQKFSAQQGGAGVGAADPAAIDYVPHQKNFEDMIKALKKGGKPLVDGAEGRKAVEIILAIYRSALKGGKPVQLFRSGFKTSDQVQGPPQNAGFRTES
jgi:predicted dehydrogenase